MLSKKMLLGYDKNGEIQFIFTDSDYLEAMYPENMARISNFLKVKDHGLKEFFVNDFNDIENIDAYLIVDGKLKKKENYERKKRVSCAIENKMLPRATGVIPRVGESLSDDTSTRASAIQ